MAMMRSIRMGDQMSMNGMLGFEMRQGCIAYSMQHVLCVPQNLPVITFSENSSISVRNPLH